MTAPAFGRVLARPGQGRIPVFVVTGFLGAGKTTLLRSLLASAAGRSSALVVNEFGTVGIDDALLREGGERTVLLGNGCVCCVVQSDLQRVLRDLFADRSAGRVSQFGRVIIEMSGLADPAGVLQTFAADRALGQHYALAAVIAVVDAAAALSTTAPEWERQIVLADRLVVTKADLVTADELARVTARIADMNPAAPTAVAHDGSVPADFLLAEATSPMRTARFCETRHGDAYRSFVLTYDQPMSWDVFSLAMRTLAELRGPDLLRVKGLVHVAGLIGPVLVQFVQHLEHPPEPLAAWPDSDRRTRMVFITRGVSERQVALLLSSVFAMVG